MFTHKIISKTTKALSALSVGLMLLAGLPITALAVGNFVANQTTAEASQVKASQILSVVSVPAAATTLTIGTCTITFQASGSGVETDCSDFNAKIKQNGVSTSTIAQKLREITGLTDAAHGALSVSGSGATAIFTTSGNETSATDITLTNNTAGAIGSAPPVTGVIGASQVVTFTPSAPENGETFRATINGTPYDYVIGTATVQGVVEGLNPLMDANAAVTCTEDDTKVTCTGDEVGTSFTFDATVIAAPAPTTGSLTVNKVVVGGTATTTDFALFVDGSAVESGVATTTSAGVHVVSETPVAGYTGSFSGGCDISGNVTVSTSTPAICTLTNTFATSTATSTGSITVNKVVLNSSGATTTDNTAFTISLNGAATTTVSDDSPAVFSGLTLDLEYLLSEAALAGYDIISINPSATTTLTSGATSTTITIINQQQATSTPVENYAVTIDTPVITSFTVDLTGTASTSNSIGNASQYDVQVDWGDASSTDSSPHTFAPSVGDFSGVWGTDSHTYSTPGTYTVIAKLYHGPLSGNEGSATSSVQVTVPAVATSTGVIVVNKVVFDPSGATTTDSAVFTFKLNGTISATGSDSSQAVFSGLAAGEYVLSEDATSTYDLISISPSATTTVSDGATTTITVVNQQHATSTASTTATINIHKVTNPGSHNTNFNFSLNQGTTTVATTTANASTGDGSFVSVAPGTYKIVEGDTPLWAFSSVECTGGVPEDADTPNHAVNLTVAAGDNVTCTFTNIAESGIVHVVKQILASDGSTVATFDDTLFGVHAVGFDGNIGQFNSGATSAGLFPGTYTLTEDANANYDLVSITSNTNASTTSGEFTIANGTTTEITVVNRQHASSTGRIIVHKAANPSDSGESFTFNLAHGETALGTATTTGTSTAEFNNLPGGTYNITEVQVSGWTFNGVVCEYDGEETGTSIPFGESVTIDANDVVDCTFTNTSTTGTIKVVKNVIDSNNAEISDTHAFSVTLNGTSTKTVAEGSDAIYTGLATSSIYTIAENSDSGYDLVSISASSTVSVEAGTTTVVTITNRKHAVSSGGSGGGSTGGGSSATTGGSTFGTTTAGTVLGAATDTSGGTGTTGTTGNTGTTYTGGTGTTYAGSNNYSGGSGTTGGGSTFLAQLDDATSTEATTTDLVQMPSDEELNQLAAVGATASGAAIGSWFWWLLLLIILAILYYLYRRSKLV